MALSSGDRIQPPASTPTLCLLCSCNLTFLLHFAGTLGPASTFGLFYISFESCKTAANRMVHCVWKQIVLLVLNAFQTQLVLGIQQEWLKALAPECMKA